MVRKLATIGILLAALGAAGLLYPTLVGDIRPSLWTASIASFGTGCICIALSVLRRTRP